ncbi:hypothetical protein [Georgenia faecalis]|uniref:LPXTG cell wall anchor domain-containing protein n=1 Tax=Georgenia faecalis TaxID=2483799 RepID=A0ABV9DBL8_9MICO|nr:hypothetical protein [Georgenia faecalis]
MDDNTTGPRSADRSGDMLAWVLIGVLALITLSLFVFEGPAQSTAIVVSLIVGLAGIALSSRAKKQP